MFFIVTIYYRRKRKRVTVIFISQTYNTQLYHQTDHPPSTKIFCPVINEPASEQSKATVPFKSSGNPILLAGHFSANLLINFGFSLIVLGNGYAPGLKQFTRILYLEKN